MDIKELFFKALEEWDEKTPKKDTNTLNSYLLYMLFFHLGWQKYKNPTYEMMEKLNNSKELCLKEFENYIDYLGNNNYLRDNFIFGGLKNLFDNFFQFRIEQLGERIIRYREAVDDHIDFYGSVDKIPSDKMDMYEEYKRITSENYIKRINYEKQVWDIVCAKYLNKEAIKYEFNDFEFTPYM